MSSKSSQTPLSVIYGGAVDGVDEEELRIVGDDGDLVVEVVVHQVTHAAE